LRSPRERLRRFPNSRLGSILFDVAVGVFWALLKATIVAFMSGVSQFIYIDF
jgi:hypothetical protein